MMQLILFELKKQMKQKKLYLFLIVPLIFLLILFFQNNEEQARFLDNKMIQIDNYLMAVDMHKAELQYENGEDATKQRQAMTEIGSVLFAWKQAVREEQYPESLTLERDFLNLLVDYEDIAGPILLSVQERNVALEKNAILLQHDYRYINEEHPVDPLLFTVQMGTWIFSLFGIVFTILLFGNLVLVEKEGKTLPFLFTQPIKKSYIVLAKFLSTLFIVIMTMFVTIGVTFLVCFLFGDATFYWHYPMYTATLETFAFVSPGMIIGRIILYFISLICFALSIALLVSCFTSSSFTQIVMTLQVLLFGYLITDFSPILNTGWNPFYLFHQLIKVDELLTTVNVLYCVWIILLSILILIAAIRAFKTSPQQTSKRTLLKSNLFNPSKAKWPTVNSFYFEMRKQWMHGLVGKAFLFCGLLVIIGFIYIEGKMNELEQRRLENFQRENATEEIIKSLERNILQLELAGNLDENSLQQKAMLQQSLDELKRSHQLQTEALEGILNKEYEPLLRYQLHSDEKMLKQKKDSVDAKNSLHELTIQANITEKKLLIERNIEPFLGGGTITTVLDTFENEKGQEYFEELNESIDNSALYTLYLYFTKYAYWLIIIVFAVLLGVGIAAEYGKRNTIQFIKTQPLKLKKIYTGKVLASSSIVVGSIIVILVGTALFTAIFNGMGPWHYPIFHYDSAKAVAQANYNGIQVGSIGFHFISLGEWILSASVLLVGVALFIIVIGHLFGLLFKQRLIVYVAVTFICALGYVCVDMLPAGVVPFNPFTYFDIPRVVNGEIAFSYNNVLITYGLGIACLLFASAMTVLLSYFISTKIKKYS